MICLRIFAGVVSAEKKYRGMAIRTDFMRRTLAKKVRNGESSCLGGPQSSPEALAR
jgi:hypothetical protein